MSIKRKITESFTKDIKENATEEINKEINKNIENQKVKINRGFKRVIGIDTDNENEVKMAKKAFKVSVATAGIIGSTLVMGIKNTTKVALVATGAGIVATKFVLGYNECTERKEDE